ADHEQGEEDREPARGPDVVRLALGASPAEVPVVRRAGGESVERRGQGAHGGGEDAGQYETADAHGHDVENVRAEDVRGGLGPVGGILLVVGEEQDSDEDEGGRDRQIQEGGGNQAA